MAAAPVWSVDPRTGKQREQVAHEATAGESLEPASDAPRLLSTPDGDFQLLARVTVALVPDRPYPTGRTPPAWNAAVDLYGAEGTAGLGLRRRYERTGLRELERRRLIRSPAPVDSIYLAAALAPPLMAR